VPTRRGAHSFLHLGFALVNACLLWLVYVALERTSAVLPDIMISWTRVLAADRDAGRRDVLIGVSAGILVLLVSFSVPLIASLSKALPPRGFSFSTVGARFALAAQLRAVPNALQNAMLVALSSSWRAISDGGGRSGHRGRHVRRLVWANSAIRC